MDRQLISLLAHADHPIAAPLEDTSVGALLDRALTGAERVLDLGCGMGEWLLRALVARPGLFAEGVDISAPALARAREGAERLGLRDRLRLHHQSAEDFTSPDRFDLVLNIGATHAQGGLPPTLAAARRHLRPQGMVLVGEGFWEREPDQAALGALGAAREDYDDLATTVDRVVADGWTPVYAHTSTSREWDDYEWSWTGSLSRWALDHPGDPDAGKAMKAADAHRSGWLRGYRGTLGFVCLLLRRTSG
ncbi:MAG TPA: class I SAM-dependent methyltransferase [Actinomadura sp.]|jgi:SAM-dependent methyltransferase|nr:class I SAM-dependent methyltransferase [Actinomadura sp.]